MSASSRLPSAQNNSHANLSYFGAAFSDFLYNPGKGDHGQDSSALSWFLHEEHEQQFIKGLKVLP